MSRTDYAINSGPTGFWVGEGPQTKSPAELTALDNTLRRDDAARTTGVSFARSEVRIAQIRDGTTMTYLVGEKYLTPDNYQSGDDGADNQPIFIGIDIDMNRVTREPPLRDRPGFGGSSRFGSAHAEGFFMSYCDGHVKLVNYSVAPTVHRDAGDRNDGNSAGL